MKAMLYRLALLALVLPGLAVAQIPLRQSTASQAFKIGPLLSSTDGNTEMTALTVANTDVKLSKAGGSFASKNSGGCTHDAAAYYTCTLDATDSNTLGLLQVEVHVATALPVRATFWTYTADQYDFNYAAAFTAGAYPKYGIARTGTAQSATSTTLVMDAAAAIADNTAVGQQICAFGSSQGYWQCRVATGNTLSSDTITIDSTAAWTVTPSGTITYILWMNPPSNMAAVIATMARLDGMLENSGPSRFTAPALAQAPAVTSENKTGTTTSTGSTNTFVDTGRTETLDDYFKDWEILITGGANNGKSVLISTYNGTTKGFTLVESLPSVIASGVTYRLKPSTAVRLAAISHTGAAIPLVSADVNAILDTPIDGSYTVKQLLRLYAAVLLGKNTGNESSTPIYRSVTDAKTRVNAVLDSNRNRTSVTLDATP